MQFASALRKNGVPFDLQIFKKNGHGMGLGSRVHLLAEGAGLLGRPSPRIYGYFALLDLSLNSTTSAVIVTFGIWKIRRLIPELSSV
jgi:hypothetical protein